MASKKYTKALISEINITPLVDVMMVILIIFMVTSLVITVVSDWLALPRWQRQMPFP